MNIKLFYDTETTGLPDFGSPSEAEHQPHIVQLAASLVDTETRQIIERISVIVRPDGWDIPVEASNVHGITTEIAMRKGMGELDALNLFLDMAKQTPCRVAHNISFDERILRIAICRHQSKESADTFRDVGQLECTAKLATPVLRLPPTAKMIRAGRNHFKTPNLTEAYERLTGSKMTGAHDAQADVRACIAIYFAIQDLAANQPTQGKEAEAC